MKTKTTKKNMKASYNRIVSIGYCDLQHLLQYQEAIAYSTRAEGWACDYYEVDNVLISTGYAPLSNVNVNCSYDTVKKYEDLARSIVLDYDKEYEVRKNEVQALLQEFINKITA